jgi:NACalpha-BTF3-like transcription factor
MAGTNLGKDGDDDDMPELEAVEGEKKKDEEEDEGEISEGDLEDKDIEVVMNQVGNLFRIL